MATLDGKIALVTGAGQGLGQGIALALASEGAAIAVVDLNAAAADATAARICERGTRAVAITADVARPEDIARSVDETVVAFGGLNILVNNAQTFPLGPLLEVSEEAIASGFATGPIATLRYMRACHPHLKGGGVIINMSSPAALSPGPGGLGIYSGVKSATQAFTRAAALELVGDRIRVFAILPVGTSPANEAMLLDPVRSEQVLGSIPMRRIGDAETEIGAVAAFLCGPSASYMTGAFIPVDGGASHLR